MLIMQLQTEESKTSLPAPAMSHGHLDFVHCVLFITGQKSISPQPGGQGQHHKEN